MRAGKIEHLKALAHEVDMRCAGALQAAEWDRIQRRRDQRHTVSHGGYQVSSFGAGHGEIEYRGGGRILGVR